MQITSSPVKLNIFPGTIEQEEQAVSQFVLAHSLIADQQQMLSELEVL
jgi:hypothetical protein